MTTPITVNNIVTFPYIYLSTSNNAMNYTTPEDPILFGNDSRMHQTNDIIN